MSLVRMKLAAGLLLVAAALAAGPSFAGGKRISGANTPPPQPVSASCASQGGTESGKMCTLPNGNVCNSATLAGSGKCVDENGVELPEAVSEEDTGTNDSSPTTGDAPTSPDSGGD
jgi:hypothetical protein